MHGINTNGLTGDVNGTDLSKFLSRYNLEPQNSYWKNFKNTYCPF